MKEAAKLLTNLEIEDRVDCFKEAEPFITLKDHKENFNLRPSCRLINPAKSNTGKISKIILERAINAIRTATGANLWKSSKDVIDWFKLLQDKKNLKFIKFDVDSFYPSITKKLFLEAIEFAKDYVEITDEEIELLLNARKSFVIRNEQVWVKIDGEDFDVTMGAYDGAEVAELVVLFLLSKIKQVIPSAGMYRDDGAAAVKMSGPQIQRAVKKLHKIFADYGLKITVEANLKQIDFLDFEMNLETGIVRPWRKPGNEPKYINVNASHPINIIKCLPKMIESRLSSLSTTKTEFEQIKGPYVDALKEAGYKDQTLNISEIRNNNNRKNRKRHICWFNPPYSSQVSTNLTKFFNHLIRKHFKKDTLLGKLFNTNNLKLSYSTTSNKWSQ